MPISLTKKKTENNTRSYLKINLLYTLSPNHLLKSKCWN